jgi:hypothetical protein
VLEVSKLYILNIPMHDHAEHGNEKIKKKALFWLCQSGIDHQAVARNTVKFNIEKQKSQNLCSGF